MKIITSTNYYLLWLEQRSQLFKTKTRQICRNRNQDSTITKIWWNCAI